MLIALSITSTGCQTVPVETPRVSVPSFPAPPARPTLEEVPQDNLGALRALTTNLSRLVATIEQWESYDLLKDRYYRTVIELVGR